MIVVEVTVLPRGSTVHQIYKLMLTHGIKFGLLLYNDFSCFNCQNANEV